MRGWMDTDVGAVDRRDFIDTSRWWGEDRDFLDGGSGDSTTSDGLDRLETNKERILHHNLELYLIINREMSKNRESRIENERELFLEGSGTFRNLPEPS